MRPDDDRPIKPNECLLGIGVPVSYDAFKRDLRDQRKDFVRNRCPSWNRYHTEVVSFYEWAKPQLVCTGAEIAEDFRLEDLTLACGGKYHVVAVLSHWTGTHIEFADGIKDAEEITAAVPPTFDGILDLSVCHPIPVAVALDHNRSCLVKVSRREVPPNFALSLYTLVLTALREETIGYLAALERAFKILRESEG